MQDLQLLHYLGTSKEVLDSTARHIKDYTVTPEANEYIKYMKQYYKDVTTATTCNDADFITYVCNTCTCKEEKKYIYRNMYDNIMLVDTSTSIYKTIIKRYKDIDIAMIMQDISEGIISGDSRVDVNTYQEELDKYEATAIEVDPEDFVTDDLDVLMEEAVGGHGYEWRLEELNLSLGPARKGNLIVVAAFVETGKTSFLASEVSHMAHQLPENGTILWVNNEERSKVVKLRYYTAGANMSKNEMEADIVAARANIKPLQGTLHMLGDNRKDIYYKDVEKYCEALNPSIIVIDILDKVHGFEDKRDDLALKRLYRWARTLANKYGPVICASQCDGTAADMRWLSMIQLEGSRVAKQGEADAILMIGRSCEHGEENRRYISIPKNKLAGGPRSQEALRHARWEVGIDSERGRYISSLK